MPPLGRLAALAGALVCISYVNAVWTTPSLVSITWQLQPGNGTAGDPLDWQPSVNLVRRSTEVDNGEPYSLTGVWYAQRWQCVTPWAVGPFRDVCLCLPLPLLRAEAVLEYASNPLATLRSSGMTGTTAEFFDGQANFTDLYINEAGWYSIRVVADGLAEVTPRITHSHIM